MSRFVVWSIVRNGLTQYCHCSGNKLCRLDQMPEPYFYFTIFYTKLSILFKGKSKLFDISNIILRSGQFYCLISAESAPTFSPVTPLRASVRVNVRTTVNTAWLLLDSLFMLVAATVLDLLPSIIRSSISWK